MTRVAQRITDATHLQRVDRPKSDIRLGAGLFQQLPHVQLVLASDDGLGGRTRQTTALGDQCRRQRTLEFMVGEHRLPAAPARGGSLQVGEAIEVETRHAELSEQPARMKAAPVEQTSSALEPRVRQRIIVLIKQQADAARIERLVRTQQQVPGIRSGWSVRASLTAASD